MATRESLAGVEGSRGLNIASAPGILEEEMTVREYHDTFPQLNTRLSMLEFYKSGKKTIHPNRESGLRLNVPIFLNHNFRPWEVERLSGIKKKYILFIFT
jgi:hypothetical protein